MEAKELRVGNYVQYPNLKRPIRVSIIDTTETTTNTKAQPIPLTEEILLKCGFKERHLVQWNGNGADYQPENVYTQQRDFTVNHFIVRYETFVANGEQSTNMCCGLIGDWYEKISFDSLLIYELEYLHQLQNLYFALTNEELTINL